MSPGQGAVNFLSGGGEMGALMRSLDWSKTPLGPVETWSAALRMTVRFLLANRFPLILWWGSEYIQFYNDPYSSILGAKHPKSMGQPARKCWAEIWHIIGPLIDRPFQGGPATWMEDIQLEIDRHGFVEETHFTVAFSPVPDDTATRGIGGVLGMVHEITETVVGERRAAILRDLSAHVGDARTAEAACRIGVETLAKHSRDVPFALVYLVDPEGKLARIAGAAGIDTGNVISPSVVDLGRKGSDQTSWPIGQAMRTGTMQVIRNLDKRFAMVLPGPWAEPPHTAVVLPIPSIKGRQIAGLLIAGISPRLRFNDQYRSFLDLMTTQFAAAIANARAYEEERQRAEALAEFDRAKTKFFSNVSHEFRTPLTLLLSPLEEVLAKPAGEVLPPNRRLVAFAHRNALRLQRLVNTLLDFSRNEARRSQASYEPTDLARFTAELASNFRSTCDRAGLQLDIDCARLPAPVYVDRDMWEKIILNLLSNAFKFTLEGGIRVCLRSRNGHAELSVSDSGVGIPEHELPRVFERFHRIEGQRSRSIEGSGIGLALVRDLVALHGGIITVASEVERGTTFTVRLPFGTAHLPAERVGTGSDRSPSSNNTAAFVEEALRWLPHDPPPEDVPSQADAEKERAPAGERPHILFADDNADMRDYVTRLLSSRWTVEAVADGRAALEAARRRRPDLVLTDMMMPRLDGFALLSALRQDATLADVSVIALSARAGEEMRIQGLGAGADDYLVKPFSARELLARVAAHLALSRLRADHLAGMSRLHELSSRLTVKSDLPSLLYEVLDATIGLQHADFGNIQLYDKETRTLEIVAQRGFGRAFVDHFRSVSVDEGSAWGQTLKRGKRVIVEDVDCDPDYEPHRHIAVAAGYRAVQSTPLVERGSGEPVGMLSMHFRNPHRPTARDLWLTDLYARQAADVIALRVSEQRLRDSETRLKAAIDLVGLSPYTWDPATGAVEWDARLKAMWGLPPDAHVDEKVFLAGIHSDDRSRVEAAIARCVDPRGDGIYAIEHRVIGIGDGVERWVSTQGQTFFENGRPVGFVGAALDITERTRAERLLRESEERFRQFAEHSTNVIGIFNTKKMRFEYVNPAYERVWGESRERMLEDFGHWLDAIHPEDRPQLAAAVDRVRLGETVIEQYRIIRPDGAMRWLRGTLFPIQDEQGRVQRIGGITEDITRHEGRFVYVIDANDASRQSLSRRLCDAGYDVTAFPSGKTFLEAAPALTTGCVVLDIRRPEAGGLVIPRELKALRIGLPVIVLGEAQGDVMVGVQVMKAGAVDFLPIPYGPDELLTAVASAMAEIRGAEEHGQEIGWARARIAELSVREREVLEGMLAGQTNKQIGRAIGISPRTVEVHRARVMQRLGAKTLPEAVRIASMADMRAASVHPRIRTL